MKVKAVVFDWAGTIVDFGSLAPMAAFVSLFERHGVSISVDQARIPMGLPKLAHIRALGAMPDIAAKWLAAHDGRAFTEHDAEALLREFEPMSAASAWEARAFVPGFMDAYAWLRSEGIRVATTTGYTRRIMAPLIAHALAQGFAPDAVVCCDDVAHSRPDPMGMRACCVAMGVEAGAQVFKVDDTAPGIAEALNAGCTAVGVSASGNALSWSLKQWQSTDLAQRDAALIGASASLRAAGAHHVIPSVADLPQLLLRLGAERA